MNMCEESSFVASHNANIAFPASKISVASPAPAPQHLHVLLIPIFLLWCSLGSRSKNRVEITRPKGMEHKKAMRMIETIKDMKIGLCNVMRK